MKIPAASSCEAAGLASTQFVDVEIAIDNALDRHFPGM